MKTRNILKEWATRAWNVRLAAKAAYAKSDECNDKSDYLGVERYDNIGATRMSEYRDLCSSVYLNGLSDSDIQAIAEGSEPTDMYERGQIQIS